MSTTPEGKELYDCVLDGNWHRVASRCKSALEARETETNEDGDETTIKSYSYVDPDSGDTALHVACRNRPPVRAMKSLLDLVPELTMVENVNTGEIPLHLACQHNATLDVLRRLVANHPQSACFQSKSPPKKKKTSKFGGGRRFGAAAKSTSSSSASADVEHHKTPLRSLWDSRTTTDTNAKENYNTVFWQKVQALLEAIARFRQESEGGGDAGQQSVDGGQDADENGGEGEANTSSLLLVHAAVYATLKDAPPAILDFALDKMSQQVHQRDATQKLPLHVAIGPAQWTDAVASKQFKFLSQEQQVISKLLTLSPHAASVCNEEGRYPMHSAVYNQHTWLGGVKEVFENAPEATYQVDPVTHFYPFQLAAIPVREQAAVDLDTIFCLLRVQPDVFGDQHRVYDFSSVWEKTQSLTLSEAAADAVESVKQTIEVLTEQAGQIESDIAESTSSPSISPETVLCQRKLLEIRRLLSRMQEKLEILSADGQRRAEMAELRRQAMDQITQRAKLGLKETQGVMEDLIGPAFAEYQNALTGKKGKQPLKGLGVTDGNSTIHEDGSAGAIDIEDTGEDQLHEQQDHLNKLEKQLAAFKKQRRPVVVHLQTLESWLVDRGALDEMNKLDEAMKITQEYLESAVSKRMAVVQAIQEAVEKEKEKKAKAAQDLVAKKMAAEQEKIAKEEQEALARQAVEKQENEERALAAKQAVAKKLAAEREKKTREEKEAMEKREAAARAKEEKAKAVKEAARRKLAEQRKLEEEAKLLQQSQLDADITDDGIVTNSLDDDATEVAETSQENNETASCSLNSSTETPESQLDPAEIVGSKSDFQPSVEFEDQANLSHLRKLSDEGATDNDIDSIQGKTPQSFEALEPEIESQEESDLKIPEANTIEGEKLLQSAQTDASSEESTQGNFEEQPEALENPNVAQVSTDDPVSNQLGDTAEMSDEPLWETSSTVGVENASTGQEDAEENAAENIEEQVEGKTQDADDEEEREALENPNVGQASTDDPVSNQLGDTAEMSNEPLWETSSTVGVENASTDQEDDQDNAAENIEEQVEGKTQDADDEEEPEALENPNVGQVNTDDPVSNQLVDTADMSDEPLWETSSTVGVENASTGQEDAQENVQENIEEQVEGKTQNADDEEEREALENPNVGQVNTDDPVSNQLGDTAEMSNEPLWETSSTVGVENASTDQEDDQDNAVENIEEQVEGKTQNADDEEEPEALDNQNGEQEASVSNHLQQTVNQSFEPLGDTSSTFGAEDATTQEEDDQDHGVGDAEEQFEGNAQENVLVDDEGKLETLFHEQEALVSNHLQQTANESIEPLGNTPTNLGEEYASSQEEDDQDHDQGHSVGDTEEQLLETAKGNVVAEDEQEPEPLVSQNVEEGSMKHPVSNQLDETTDESNEHPSGTSCTVGVEDASTFPEHDHDHAGVDTEEQLQETAQGNFFVDEEEKQEALGNSNVDQSNIEECFSKQLEDTIDESKEPQRDTSSAVAENDASMKQQHDQEHPIGDTEEQEQQTAQGNAIADSEEEPEPLNDPNVEQPSAKEFVSNQRDETTNESNEPVRETPSTFGAEDHAFGDLKEPFGEIAQETVVVNDEEETEAIANPNFDQSNTDSVSNQPEGKSDELNGPLRDTKVDETSNQMEEHAFENSSKSTNPVGDDDDCPDDEFEVNNSSRPEYEESVQSEEPDYSLAKQVKEQVAEVEDVTLLNMEHSESKKASVLESSKTIADGGEDGCHIKELEPLVMAISESVSSAKPEDHSSTAQSQEEDGDGIGNEETTGEGAESDTDYSEDNSEDKDNESGRKEGEGGPDDDSDESLDSNEEQEEFALLKQEWGEEGDIVEQSENSEEEEPTRHFRVGEPVNTYGKENEMNWSQNVNPWSKDSDEDHGLTRGEQGKENEMNMSQNVKNPWSKDPKEDHGLERSEQGKENELNLSQSVKNPWSEDQVEDHSLKRSEQGKENELNLSQNVKNPWSNDPEDDNGLNQSEQTDDSVSSPSQNDSNGTNEHSDSRGFVSKQDFSENLVIPKDPWASDWVEEDEKLQQTIQDMKQMDDESTQLDDEDQEDIRTFHAPEEFDGAAYLQWLEDGWEDQVDQDDDERVFSMHKLPDHGNIAIGISDSRNDKGGKSQRSFLDFNSFFSSSTRKWGAGLKHGPDS